MFNRTKRSGFTLPEVLVTVAIIAILAAAVVPAVTQQISKGEDGQFVSGVQGLQTAATSYVADVRRYPLFLSDLTEEPNTGDSTMSGVLLSAAEKARWRGPYVQLSLDSAQTLALGLGLDAKDHLWKDSTFAAVTIATSNADSSMVVHADSLLDSGNGNGQGRVQWSQSTATFDSAWVRIIIVR